MGVGELFFCTAVFAIGVYRMKITIETPRTLAFVVIVVGNRYVVSLDKAQARERAEVSVPGRACV
jgi:hypothetical protein